MKAKYLLTKCFLALIFFFFSANASSALTYYSKMDGLWSDSNSWVTDKCGGSVNAGTYPKSGDEVIICDGITITVEGNLSCKKLTVGTGSSGVISYSNASTTFLYVLSDIELKPGARIEYKGNTGQKHFLAVEGDIKNEGLIDFRVDTDDYVIIEFLGNTDSKIVSSSGSWVLSTINLKKGIKSAVVSIENDGFSKALTDGSMAINYTSVSLTKGILRHNASGELGNIYEPGKTVSDPMTIPANVGLEGFKGVMRIVVNNITYLQGNIRVAGGTITVSLGAYGSFTPYGLYYQGNTSGITLQNDGVLVVNGAFKDDPATPSSSVLLYIVATGRMEVGLVKTTVQTFRLTPACKFHMSWGEIILHHSSDYSHPSVVTPTDFELMANSCNVTGGKVLFGGSYTVNPQTFRFTGCKQFPHLVVNASSSFPITVMPYTDLCQSSVYGWKFDVLSLTIGAGKAFDMQDARTGSNHTTVNITSASDSIGFQNDGAFNARTSWVNFTGRYQYIKANPSTVFSSLQVGFDPFDSGELWTGPILKTNILVRDTTTLVRNFDLNGNELKTGISDAQPGFMSVNPNCGVFHGTLTRYFKKNKDLIEFSEKLNDFGSRDLPFYITDLSIIPICGIKHHLDRDNASRTLYIAAHKTPQSSGYISVRYKDYHQNGSEKMFLARCNYMDGGEQVNVIAGFNWAISADFSLSTGLYYIAAKHLSLTLDNPNPQNLRLLQLEGDLLSGVGTKGFNVGSAPLIGTRIPYLIFGKPCFFYIAKSGYAGGLIYVTRYSLSYADLNNRFYMGTLADVNPATSSQQVSSLTFRFDTGADPYPFPTIARLDSDARVTPTESLESQESVFPNPVQKGKEVSIAIPTEMKTDNVSIQLVNVYGEKVIENSFTVDSSRKITIDLSKYNLKEGIYMILVSDGKASWRQRLVITK